MKIIGLICSEKAINLLKFKSNITSAEVKNCGVNNVSQWTENNLKNGKITRISRGTFTKGPKFFSHWNQIKEIVNK